MLQGLRTVVVHVEHLGEARNWYAAALGIQPYYDTAYYVGFNVGGYELGLHPMEGKDRPQGTATVAYWGVDDVQAAIEQLLASGAQAFEPAKDVGGDIIVGAVRDPWGNVLGLIRNPHFDHGPYLRSDS